ncbi:MAG: amino acid ABC transporter permease [Planctomycetes bacterium]|jgi:osmoprotectant transport system permease protein|nr:amino acid ABC transporter permease [Planctomycetota bacterium]
MRKRTAALLAVVLVAALVPLSSPVDAPRVGSKKFTESVILGELVAAAASGAGVEVLHARELGGTRILFQALLSGEIDVYPEYTGTIAKEILAGEGIEGEGELRSRLLEDGVIVSRPFGFNNGYAIGMLEERAQKLGIRTVSDLASHPDLVFGFSNEFMDREDGWPALQRVYGLAQRDVSGMDHDLAYRQLASGSIDAMEVYTTDAGIRYHGIRTLEDDRGHFPLYQALLLYRADLAEREPQMVAAMLALEERISEEEMMALNAAAQLERIPEREVAASFIARELGVEVELETQTRWDRLCKHTLEHLELVRRSFLLAVLCGLPLGILAAKKRRAGQLILAVVGVIQTIPALALLVVLIEPAAALGLTGVGTGSAAAICALFLYSLLPIVRNTCEGLRGIPPELRESAEALGLPPAARLRLVELPLASRTILAGLKTAAILNVGFATLGALIGAGGYGQPILTGIRLDDYALILEGALPSAALALLVQALFELCDRIVIPAGLRLSSQG